MLSKKLYAAALLAGMASAGIIRKRASGGQTVYWGQSDSEQTLSEYCTSSQGIDIIILSFLDSYGNDVTPHGTIGGCTINSDGMSDGYGDCDSLISGISTCQSNGVKVFLSIGGASATGSLNSQADAEGVAWSLWNSYAAPSAVDSSAARPFGSSFVNGWDFDIESNPNGNDNYQYLISALRGYFAQDSSNTYYISGAPQCPIPEPNMGTIISNSKFDYLWVQFYNNPGCSAYDYADGSGNINFDDWENFVQGTASAGASLYIGLPASGDAATGYDNGSYQWLDPSQMQNLVNGYRSHAGFGGVMLWDAAYSDAATENGCTYAQEVSSVLSSGNIC